MIARLGEALAEASEGAAAGLSPVCSWEVRVRVRGPRRASAAIDGGARVDWIEGGDGAATRSRYAVGAGPEELLRLVRGAPSRGASSWAVFVEGVIDDALDLWAAWEAEIAPVRRAAAAGVTEVSARLRGRSRRGERPFVEHARGVRVAVRDAPGEPAPSFEWSGPADADAGRVAAAAAAAAPAAGPAKRPGARPCPEGREGPAVLLPGAAAWWVHEMAHAAFEGATGRGTAGAGARIVEDPSRAAWPYGFDVDDEVHPARRTVLWGEGCPARVPRRGHLRRASIRDEARPGPAATRLELPREPVVALDGLPEGWPVAARVEAGRLDPSTGAILLSATRMGVTDGIGWTPVPWSAVIVVEPQRSWKGLEPVRTADGPRDVRALCTREGRANPVMVGAPTVVLDAVRLLRAGRTNREAARRAERMRRDSWLTA